jgi:hypothetical protein
MKKYPMLFVPGSSLSLTALMYCLALFERGSPQWHSWMHWCMRVGVICNDVCVKRSD